MRDNFNYLTSLFLTLATGLLGIVALVCWIISGAIHCIFIALVCSLVCWVLWIDDLRKESKTR